MPDVSDLLRMLVTVGRRTSRVLYRDLLVSDQAWKSCGQFEG